MKHCRPSLCCEFQLLAILQPWSSRNSPLCSMMFAISPFFVLALLGAASAHPGEHEQHGTLARREFLDFAQRSVAGCQNHVSARAFEARAIARRASLAEKLRARRGLPVKRDYTAYLNTSHLSNATGLTSSSTGTEIFTGNVSCVLQGEVTVGPYCKSFVFRPYFFFHLT